MAQPDRIAVYGASGYTGKLVMSELAKREIEFVAVGRNEIKLRAMMRELGIRAVARQATLDDPSTLRRAFKSCSAVIDCAGPFTKYGRPVVEAAIDSGTHYLDTTGEQLYIKMLFDEFDAPAREAGVALVPAMGFDYAPGDLLCSLVSEDIEPLEEIVIAYALQGSAASRGTVESMMLVLESNDVKYEDGEWTSAGIGPVRATFGFPKPIGRKPVGKFPSGEIVTVPHHVKTDKVTSLISMRSFAPSTPLARAMPLLLPGASLALKTPIGKLTGSLINRLPEGPDEKTRKASRFTIVITAHGKSGEKRTATLKGRDAYGLTAAMIVEGADRIRSEGFSGKGTLAPSMAFDPSSFLDSLKSYGLTYKINKTTRAPAAKR